MSRCFPFPPPGYEKKSRPDDSNLLVKEKHKEKKHKKEKDKEKKEKKDRDKKEKKDKDKKEKKDKEKKEKKYKEKKEKKDKEKKEKKDKEKKEKKDKEKKEKKEKEKERSEENRKEKKEKKDKHKEKDKERDKEKKRTPQENNDLGTSDHKDVGKPGPTGIQAAEFKPAFLLQLEKRLSNNDGATESKMLGADQVSFRFHGKVTGCNSNVLSDAKEKFKDKRDDHKMANGQTLKVVARALENGIGPSFIREDQKKDEGGVSQVEKVNEKGKERKEKKKHKKDGKGNKQQDRDQNKQSKSKDREGDKKEEKKEKVIEERSKVQIKHSNIDMVDIHSNGPSYLSDESNRSRGYLGKRKDPVSNGVICDDDSQSNKFLKPVSSSGHVMRNGSKHDPSQGACQFTSERRGKVEDNAKVSIPQSVVGNGRVLAPAHIVNGSISEQKIALNNHKVQDSLFPSQPVGGTGAALESSQAVGSSKICWPGFGSNHKVNSNVSPLQPDVENQTRSNGSQSIMLITAENQRTIGLHEADDKKYVINGLVKSGGSKKVQEKSETRKRSPHPDSKYLSQIFTVPEVEWCDFDDQEWLFTGSDSKAKKLKTVSTQVEETKQVWAEALVLESANAIALPYVIPY